MLHESKVSVEETNDNIVPLADVLRMARSRSENPENWTKGALARTDFAHRSNREATHPNSLDAHSFCMVGAVLSVLGLPFAPMPGDSRAGLPYAEYVTARKALAYAREQAYPLREWEKYNTRPSDFNDGERTSHADVLRVFDVAIQTAEDEGRLLKVRA